MVLKLARFSDIGQEQNLAWLPFQRTGRKVHVVTRRERYVVAIVEAGRERAGYHGAPMFTAHRLPEEAIGGGVTFLYNPLGVKHHNPAG